jgi:hypothetical protein
MKQCPQCGAANNNDAIFCSTCGYSAPSAITPPVANTTKAKPFPLYAKHIAVVGVALIGLVAAIEVSSLRKDAKERETARLVTPAPSLSPAPAPTPAPKPTPTVTFAELKTKYDPLLKFERTEYASSDLGQFDEAMTSLREIPKESKDYKQAQILLKKLIDKSAAISAEILVLGEKPSDAELHTAFNRYLRPRLNDYSSSEYVNYTSARKVVIKGEPFWVSTLSLRAKNAFGGYILKNVTMYIRQKEVVLDDGL